MKLQIRTIVGQTVDVNINEEISVASLKEELAKHVNVPAADQKLIHDQHLLQHGDHTLKGCGVKEGDVIVMLQTRKPVVKAPVDTTPVPDRATILKYTGGKEGKAPARTRNHRPVNPVFGFRSHLQDLMSTLMGFSSSADLDESLEESEEETQQQSSQEQSPSQPAQPPQPPRPITVDPVSIQQLKDMGFPENRAKKALILTRNNVQLAMEWLLEHGDDPNIDDPIPEPEITRISRQESEFVPNPEAVRKLKDMGFSEEDIHNALRMTGNNQEAACAWLLGDRDMDSDRLEDSSVIQNVLAHPAVQAGLSNPRVLQALKMMIENPASAHQFINDPEIGPILMQVHNIIENQ